MARQQYYADPSQKHLEVYYDFSGGLNTVTSNDSLSNNELIDISNISLGERGSLKRRHGMVRHLTPPTGKGQGYFRYYTGPTYEEFVAVNGKLYKNGVEMSIEGLTEGFQTTRPIEAAQLNKTLYIATGTKLVEYTEVKDEQTQVSSMKLRVVTPKKPEPLEALYIGTNGLSDNPDEYLQDGEGSVLRIDGVTVSKRYGIVNQETVFTAYISKPVNMTSVDYEFKYRKKGTETWTTGKAFSTSKTFTFKPTEAVEYEFDIYARETGISDPTLYARYILPSYKVNQVDKNEASDSTGIQTCNRILTYWSQLVLYGDTVNPENLYISDINKGDYFPVPNSLKFIDGRREGLSALVPYRNSLIAFTPSSIQAIYGKNPSEFQRVILNTQIGCIAPYSACVMGNYIAFLSREGVQILKSLGYAEDRLNVEKIDRNINNLMELSTDACGYTLNGEYHLVFPQSKKRFRFYYELATKPWTKDDSEKLDFARLYEFDGKLYGQSSSTGVVQKFDESALDDDGFVYEDVIQVKYFDFGQPYNPKKLKELQLLLGNFRENSNSKLYVYADAAKIVSADENVVYVDEFGEIVHRLDQVPNVKVSGGTVFGEWVMGESAFGEVKSTIKELRLSGKCLRTSIRLVHSEATEHQLLGLAYIFKIKKP